MAARLNLGLLCAAIALGLASAPSRGDTLSDVQKRGFLRCPIIEASPGFSSITAAGERVGMDVDHCKVIAAAVFGAIKIEFVPITPQTAFTLLQSGAVDVFPGGASWTFLRDTAMGLDFTGVYLYAGQGFLVRKSGRIHSIADLDGATICVAQGTTLEQNLADYFRAHRMRYRAVTFANIERGLDAYQADRCDAFTNEVTSITGRLRELVNPQDHKILPGVISREPMAAIVRQGDPRWRDLVLWSFNAVIAAEELGISQANVDEMRKTSGSAEAQRLLGVYGDYGAKLGLSNDWAYNIIKLVGNYNDQWQRNFGPLGLDRGVNRLWTDGGLLMSLPFR